MWRALRLEAESIAVSTLDYVKTGIVAENSWFSQNGSVQIQGSLGSTTFLFCYSGFPSKIDADQDRDALMLDTFDKSSLKPAHWTAQQLLFLTNHVFFFGDFNYGTKKGGNSDPNDMLQERMRNMSEAGLPSKATLLWACFSESDINFPPTSKFCKQATQYDNSSSKSWPDRILWKREDKGVTCLNYEYLDIRTSCTRPIVADFSVEYATSTERSWHGNHLNPSPKACCSIM
jgi:hypothetical protein